MSLLVISAGPRTLVQDLGRPGLARLGVSPSGALDPLLLRRSNALVGNRQGAACLEVLMGGLTLEAQQPMAVAVCGGTSQETMWLDAGERLAVQAVDLLAYVAVRGGLDVPTVLGSRSSDLLGGLGPAQVRDGDRFDPGDDAGPAESPPAPPPLSHAIRLLPAPRPEELPASLVAHFLKSSWTVGSDTSRVAVRLDGPPLLTQGEDVPTEGLVRGAVQLPPSGRPIVFAADYPVTGGYPVIGVVHPDDQRSVVQARPGATFQFRASPE